jgi:pimeloyl-ACP methyl ester carboxylesterase
MSRVRLDEVELWYETAGPASGAPVSSWATKVPESCRPSVRTWADIDLAALSHLPCPVLFTHGDQSFRWFPRIIEKLQAAVPHPRLYLFKGAGHFPHFTHPDDFVRVTSDFIRAVGETPPPR